MGNRGTHELQNKTSYFPLFWLVNKDPLDSIIPWYTETNQWPFLSWLTWIFPPQHPKTVSKKSATLHFFGVASGGSSGVGLNTRCGDPSGNPWVSLVGGLGASWMAGFKWNYLNQPSKRQRFRSCGFGHGRYGGQTTKKLPFHAVDPFGRRVKMFKKTRKNFPSSWRLFLDIPNAMLVYIGVAADFPDPQLTPQFCQVPRLNNFSAWRTKRGILLGHHLPPATRLFSQTPAAFPPRRDDVLDIWRWLRKRWSRFMKMFVY